MRLLVDTHVFLWYLMGDRRLSKTATTLMSDVRNELLLSMASLWEIAIKTSIGKLTLPASFGKLIPAQLGRMSIRVLEIRLDHVIFVSTLPFHHKDPFDRMLAAQSSVEGIPLLSDDAVFDRYGIHREW